jgi:hypothetical protein
MKILFLFAGLFLSFSLLGQDTIEIDSDIIDRGVFNYYVGLDTVRNVETETIHITGKTIRVEIKEKNTIKQNGKTYYILPEDEKKKAVKK